MTEMRIKVILFSGLLMAFSILIITVIILFMRKYYSETKRRR